MQLSSPQASRLRADNARAVADILRRQIHTGEITESLDERQLIDDFNVSRNTIREALSALTEEGLIERAPRIGTHVVARKLEHGLGVGCRGTCRARWHRWRVRGRGPG